jgi:predicted esterase
VAWTNDDPHGGQLVMRQGPPASKARLAVVLVHGRGGSAHDMLSLATELALKDVLYLAPQAAGKTWYPYSFLAPINQNEPGLSSGLKAINELFTELASEGLSSDRVGTLGFSQGACLSLEYVARHARRYAAVIGLSGGLIGPQIALRDYAGSLDHTPVFLGCSDIDPHIPVDRVHETAEVFRRLRGNVDERIYPGMGHTVNPEEIEAVRSLLS